MLRYTIIFYGSVQGVGFRYSTVNVANGFAVTGWVRNEPDGSVRCVVEGEKDELDRFVSAVQQAMQGHISSTQIDSSPAADEFKDFTIRR